MNNLRKGQFWYDTVNHDLLKILGFTTDWQGAIAPMVNYVRCACISNGNFFGVQEMKVSTFTESRVEGSLMLRFERLSFFEELWYSWKYRDSQLKTPPPSNPTMSKLEQRSNY